jgi:N-acetyl-1-D-myo-inositol-2-amino-2-deoxy-alpha-D-glucopyranoside deacetylase/mycothiol S-conjugate amidase
MEENRMVSQKTLLFVGAHPDDETFAIGGTLARYAASGVKVYYACATRGDVGTADAESMKGFNSVGEMRWAELQCAAKTLGLAGTFHLGYRDSGMEGSKDNLNPDSFAMATIKEASGRIVKIIREIKPQVVITHDPIGGYRHPDHIAAHRATVAAFKAASDVSLFPETGPAFQTQKLYYNVFPRRWLKIAVKLMPLFGQNPHKFGRNRDIDFASMVEAEFPIHARIRIDKKYALIRNEASSCYRSQLGGGPPRRGLFRFFSIFSSNQDFYMRAYPEVKGRLHETDLFSGVT